MSSRQANLQEDTYFRVMQIVDERPQVTQRELAEQLGVSVSGLNYCLKALVQKGWIKMQNFRQSPNKMGYAYLLTPAGATQKAALASNFLRRKVKEYESLRSEIEALQSEIKL